jgi:hypothetical protein
MSVNKFGGQTAYHDHVHQANQNKSDIKSVELILVINSTLLMSFDVGMSKISEFLTMRDRTKEELAALCFSACKLNLPLVPSQDDVPDFTLIGLWTKAAYNKNRLM